MVMAHTSSRVPLANDQREQKASVGKPLVFEFGTPPGFSAPNVEYSGLPVEVIGRLPSLPTTCISPLESTTMSLPRSNAGVQVVDVGHASVVTEEVEVQQIGGRRNLEPSQAEYENIRIVRGAG